MIMMYSVNSPGEFFISETAVHPELIQAGCLKPVEDDFYRSFVLSHQSEWVECPAYPGTLGFYPDVIPAPATDAANKKQHQTREIKHLTYSMKGLIEKALS